MPQNMMGFWGFCTIVIKKLAAFGPIGIITFGLAAIFAFTALFVTDQEHLLIVGGFFIIILLISVGFYSRESTKDLDLAKSKLELTYRNGERKIAAHRQRVQGQERLMLPAPTSDDVNGELSLPISDSGGSVAPEDGPSAGVDKTQRARRRRS